MLENPERFKDYVQRSLENEYDSELSLERAILDYEKKIGYLRFSFEDLTENPELNYFVEDITKELGIENADILSEFREKKGIYELGVESTEKFPER